ncbi:MAG TPA: alkaline phosphatase family protein [Anaerolineae bacterium]|nr:alkaline phosphatase family protein [Anaerolineae bacterium]
MQTSNRILIMGLDGATWDVLDPWIKDGTLPNLGRLRRQGSWGALRSTIPPLTAPAWSTFMTGKRPGKHGVFHFTNLFDALQQTNGKRQIVNGQSIQSPTLWDIVAHAGRRVGVINVPMSYPPRPVNGFLITCFLTPRHAPVFTYPPELSRRLPDYVIDLDRFIETKPYQGPHDSDAIAPTLALVQEFREMTDKRARTALSLMESEPWDIFMVVFTSTDRMGHYLWPYHRAPDPQDDPQVQELCRAVRQHYIRLDAIIGELVATAGDETTLLIMSDHGMGLRPSKRVHLNNWLQQRGWLSPVKAQAERAAGLDGWLRRFGAPRDKIGRIARRIPGLMNTRLMTQAANARSLEIDVKSSRAYAVSIFDTVAGIRLNPEAEQKEAWRREIDASLKQLIDPDTGERVVEEIYRGDDYYRGPYAENVPEMLVVLKPEYSCGLRLGHYSALVTPVTAPFHRGNHRMEGIFLASGRDIRANPEPLPNLAIEDVAPTALYAMGLPVPADMDGRVLTAVWEPALLHARPIQYARPLGFWPNGTGAVYENEQLSEAEEETVRQRLAALGYLD